MSIMGASGTGKTTLLKKIIEYLHNQRYNVLVIDFHGDIETPVEEVFEFTAVNSRYGLSVFEFDKDPRAGGIQTRIIEIIKTFN